MNTEFLDVPGWRLYRKTGSEHMTFVPGPLEDVVGKLGVAQ